MVHAVIFGSTGSALGPKTVAQSLTDCVQLLRKCQCTSAHLARMRSIARFAVLRLGRAGLSVLSEDR